MNYSKFLNSITLSRKPSPIRLLTALKAQCGPSLIYLAGGNPNPLLFPIKEAKFTRRDGEVIHLNENMLKVALQYDASPGNSNFLKTLKKFQSCYHNPPLQGASNGDGMTDICMTYGSSDGIAKSFEMLISPGDKVLVEEPTNPVVLSALRPLGCEVLPIETDHQGIMPSSLSSACQSSSTTPKFLYTCPNGMIPSGSTTSIQRRKEIYEIAKQHNFLILEHDPFYFLQYSHTRKPSYLSLDVDGRVLRFDSFSMLMSPGMRMGFVTGPKALVNQIVLHLMVSSMHVPTFSQVLVNELMKVTGEFESHIIRISDFYKAQREMAERLANKWLSGLAEWNSPEAGISLWLKVKNCSDSKNFVNELQQENVFFASGSEFKIHSEKFNPYIFVSFSHCSESELDQGFQKLAEKITRKK